jgi:transposase-like protein
MARPPFPKTLREFQKQFVDEEACRAYLFGSRWPEGYRCPQCSHPEAFSLPRRLLWQCKRCGHQTSGTAGTVLHRTRLSLRDWFWASYLVATHTPGLSALQLQRQLGIRRYETAWTMLHKLRRAMRRPDREALGGRVEVDETIIGNQDGLRGRELGRDRALVVGAVEVRGRACGRIRLAALLDATSPTLSGFVRRNVEPGAVVITDGWRGYDSLSAIGFRHRRKPIGLQHARALVVLPRIHQVFGNLKNWLRGTHHGVQAKHMQAYLDEFVFRFNRRRTPMAAFQSLLGLTGVHTPTTRKMLCRSESSG